MKQAFRYRIFPTKHQEATLRTQLSLCCQLYNAGLQERREAYRMGGKSITFTVQSAQLPDIKELRPEYEAIYSQVLQDVLHRLDQAFKAFFRRVKNGEVPGYPVRRIVGRFRVQQRLLELMESFMHTSLTLNLERGRRPEHARTAT